MGVFLPAQQRPSLGGGGALDAFVQLQARKEERDPRGAEATAEGSSSWVELPGAAEALEGPSRPEERPRARGLMAELGTPAQHPGQTRPSFLQLLTG